MVLRNFAWVFANFVKNQKQQAKLAVLLDLKFGVLESHGEVQS